MESPALSEFDLHLFAEKHQKRDNGPIHYRVCITLNVPDNQLIAHHDGCSNLYKAIHLAFNKLQRQLHDRGHIQSGMTKHHDAMSDGTIRRLFPHSDDRFGFIEDQLGEEFYFNPNNLSSSDFDHLKEGDHVMFVPHLADSGLQAHRVKRKKE